MLAGEVGFERCCLTLLDTKPMVPLLFMRNFPNITEQPFDRALEAKPDTKVVVGSGKGGVGKTTTNSGVLLSMERMGIRTFGLDLDGSPSLELLTAAQRPKGKSSHLINPVATSRCDEYEIPIAQCSPVIPELDRTILAAIEEQMKIITDETQSDRARSKAVTTAEGIVKKEYERLAKALLPSTIKGQQSYLPLLRPALQTMAWNMGCETKNIAIAIQLIELIANNRHLVFNLQHGEESVEVETKAASRAEVILLDTENANHLINLLKVVRQFRIFLGTLSAATGNTSTWVVSSLISNSGEGGIFKGFFNDRLRKYPEEFFQGATKVTDILRGPQSFLVQTVNPATAVTEQTLEDVQKLLEDGVCPDFFAMTRWPAERGEQSAAREIEADFLAKLSKILGVFDRTTSYKRLGETGIQPRSLPNSPDYEEVQHHNMRIMADALVRT